MQVTANALAGMTDRGFAGGYDDWRRNPVTQRVFAILNEMIDSGRLTAVRSEDALLYAGAVDAERELFAWLTKMTERASAFEVAQSRATVHLASTYGVERPGQKGGSSAV